MTSLAVKLQSRLEAEGTISFRDLMEMALYDSEYGYYTTAGDKIGRSGDFYTAANIDATFGALLARQAIELAQQLNNENRQLTLLEIGAGTGQLAVDILQALQTNYPTWSINYLICDISPIMCKRQQARLATYNMVQWVSYEQLAQNPIQAIVIANEVVDALPLHRIRGHNGQWQELYLRLAGTYLQEDWQPLTNQQIGQYLQRLTIELLDDQIIEVNLAAITWLGQIAASLSAGFVIILDYGDTSDHLYGFDHQQGTLRCFYQHTLNSNPYQHLGTQDITADVNFSALMEYGQDVGLQTIKLVRQADYLISLGLLDHLESLLINSPANLTNLKTRLALKTFFVPGGISDHFKVLIQQKVS